MKLDLYKGVWGFSGFLALVFILLAVFSVIQVRHVTLPASVTPEPVSLSLVVSTDDQREAPQVDLLQRPVFWQERRPLVVDEMPEPLPEPEPEPDPALVTSDLPDSLTDFRLRGVFYWDEFKGIVYDLAGERQRAMLGDEIAGWVLTAIEVTGITLQWHDGQDTIETRDFELDYSLPGGASVTPGLTDKAIEKPVELTPNVQDNEAHEAQDGINESNAG